MRHLALLLILLGCLSALLLGCEPKEEVLQTSGRLEFSDDSVKFDTVFTTVRTVTKRLWVYNRNSGAIKTDIQLAGRQAGTYSLIINGDAGAAQAGVLIRGRDSLLVLVRAVLGDNGSSGPPKEFIVDDQINFNTNGNVQDVKLVAYGQNAYIHRADLITSNTTWATDKPHLIISSPVRQGTQVYSVGVLVAENVTLRIPKGARIYCHAGATLQVNGTLLVNDLSEPNAFVPGPGPADTVKADNPNLVRFLNDRRERFYAETPGQWGGIVLTKTSRGNRVRYCEVKNATFGFLLYNPDNDAPQQPDLTLENVTLRNISGSNVSFANSSPFSGAGVLSYSGKLAATNCLFTNCGEYAVLGLGGGDFLLNYCTVANYTPSFRRKTASLTFTNELASDSRRKAPLNLRIHNSIVWGSRASLPDLPNELLLDNADDYYPASANGSLSIRNSLLYSTDYAAATDAPGKPGLGNPALGNVLNQDPSFNRTPESGGSPYDYRLRSGSPALNRPNPVPPVPLRDLLNLPRNLSQPDMGAYERAN